MTRDEALKHANNKLSETLSKVDLVNKIYDEFENRTCENCINDYQCDIQDELELQDYSLKFGCTFFKKRELINGK